MTTHVTDVRSNPNEQVVHAIRVIGKSDQRLAVFKAVYLGKRKIKSLPEVATASRLSKKRVLEVGLALASAGLFKKYRLNGRTVFEKDLWYATKRDQIVRGVSRPELVAKIPTKQEPHPRGRSGVITLRVPARRADCRAITIDDVASFERVRRQGVTSGQYSGSEESVKAGIQGIIGERGVFKDWGGERADLFTTRVRLDKTRVGAAFAFKGPGTKGKLVPGKLGKNGDQIQRLFEVVADVYFVQYVGQVDESVLKQMSTFALAASYLRGGRRVCYGVIDGEDTARLAAAYPKQFTRPLRRRASSRRARALEHK